MASVVHLDTHVAAWLYAGDTALLSAPAKRAIEDCDCAISPMAVLELRFLTEIGRLLDDADAVIRSLATTIGLHVADEPFGQIVENAYDLDWTRDPFDRLITAQARVAGAPLITRDPSIRAHYGRAVW